MSPAQLPSLLTAPGGRASQPLPKQDYKLPHMLCFSFYFSLRLIHSFFLVFSPFSRFLPYYFNIYSDPVLLSVVPSTSFIFFFPFSPFQATCVNLCAHVTCMDLRASPCLFILTSLERMGGGWMLGKTSPGWCRLCGKQEQSLFPQLDSSLGFFWPVWGTSAAGEANGSGRSLSSHLWPPGVYLPCLSVSSLDR